MPAPTWFAWCAIGCRKANWLANDWTGRVRIVRGDVCDQPLLERVLGEYEIDTVFHLAAQAIVGVANRNPVSTFESNIRGTWALLEACRRSPRVKQIVTASSDKAYGDHDQLPYHEDAPLEGRHPYDVSKSCADLIARSYAETYDLPVAITRCGNFYGGGDLNWNRIVPGTIRAVLRGLRPIIRSDGLFIRDYFYVEDGAAAYMRLAEHLAASARAARRSVQLLERIADHGFGPGQRDLATDESGSGTASAQRRSARNPASILMRRQGSAVAGMATAVQSGARFAADDRLVQTFFGAGIMHDAQPVCRSCGEGRLTPMLALGQMPLANRLLTRRTAWRRPSPAIRWTWCSVRAAPWCRSPKRCRRKSCCAITSTSRRSPTARCCTLGN